MSTLGRLSTPRGRQAEQVVQAAVHHQVGEEGAADEERGGGADEEVGPLLLPRVQARRDERPQLVQPDRAGGDQREEERDLDAQEERVEDAVDHQLVAGPVTARLAADHG